ncbi:alanine/ornithine racemase family PLP-dependent enzyme [Sulfitobacter geojensis]|uniref:alanine/ornithine racemase family PLP-dependent enzyme n=1 Tax=Sulfitobacter geojensis TaxID=1342299 RepID=UPI0036DF563E
MSGPRIEVDLQKIRQNTQTVVRLLRAHGVGVTAVTKAVCGHPDIATAMLDGGAMDLADARLSNVQKLRKAGITCPVTLIRTPMLSQADQVVQTCEASYNTEIDVIAALAAAAIRQNVVHGVIIMVEMGDLREGVFPENLASVAEQVIEMPGVALKGIGANFACLGGVAPTAAKMVALSTLANEIEGECGPFIQTVSGGNSANLPWAMSGQPTGRVNNLRLGEAILLGVDPLSGAKINGMHTDAFMLIAEVIETNTQPAPVTLVSPALTPLRIVSGPVDTTRLILAIGHQDTDASGLSMPAGNTLIGATSDHLVIGTNRPTQCVGSEITFHMNYSALMHAMAAPDVKVEVLQDRHPRQSRRTHSKAAHLSLV